MRNAPELQTAAWLNTERPLRLADLRGRVVLVHAFQMLCPGCVEYALPQTTRLYAKYHGRDDVVVLGLHTVFEDHAEMTPAHLAKFVAENALAFPIGIDRAREGDFMPETMRAYDMQGTPTLILVDRHGRLRLQHFGIADDRDVVAAIEALLGEPAEGTPKL